jgi:hypothetical protein
VIAGDEGGLRQLAELLAPYLPVPSPAEDRWMDSREAAEYGRHDQGGAAQGDGGA